MQFESFYVISCKGYGAIVHNVLSYQEWRVQIPHPNYLIVRHFSHSFFSDFSWYAEKSTATISSSLKIFNWNIPPEAESLCVFTLNGARLPFVLTCWYTVLLVSTTTFGSKKGILDEPRSFERLSFYFI